MPDQSIQVCELNPGNESACWPLSLRDANDNFVPGVEFNAGNVAACGMNHYGNCFTIPFGGVNGGNFCQP